VALLVSDIEGSTELFERLGEDGARRVVHVHNRVLRQCLRAYQGREVQHTGDGMIAAFTSSSLAVHCSVAVQQGCASHNRLSPREQLRVRIGLHAGLVRQEESRLFGAAVNVTVRVCSQARAGQIVITEELAHRFDASSFPLIDRGVVPLKGLSRAFQLFEVDWQQFEPQAEPDPEQA
jgi:adenylate cyclase